MSDGDIRDVPRRNVGLSCQESNVLMCFVFNELREANFLYERRQLPDISLVLARTDFSRSGDLEVNRGMALRVEHDRRHCQLCFALSECAQHQVRTPFLGTAEAVSGVRNQIL